LERLLDRESDRRKGEQGLLYIDSYGNPDALLTHPMQYDAFFIDMCHTPGVSGLQVAAALTEQGVTVPFIMCSSDVDYSAQDIPGHVIHLEKPILVAKLRETLEIAQHLSDTAEKKIELREDWASHYVSAEEILYAFAKGNRTHVYLTEGRIFKIFGRPYLLYDSIEKEHPSFVMPSFGTIVNCDHIREVKFPCRAVMDDGRKIFLHPRIMNYVRESLQRTDS
ncbi:MAG: DNA-binding response regulator, partial [Lachnospiraceae bacterium]|nr:DNA-binding response regulator [Lachnospiraceae bacterium]